MNFKLYLLFLMFFMSIGFTSAEVQTLPQETRAGICINLAQSEFNSTYQTLVAIQYPNQSVKLIGTNMTKAGYYYYYNFCDTNQTGSYIVNTVSDISVNSYDFKVTPSGEGNIVIIIVMAALTAIIILLGFTIKDEWVVALGGFMGTGVGLYILLNGIDIYKNATTNMVAIIVIFLSAYIAIRSTLEAIEK